MAEWLCGLFDICVCKGRGIARSLLGRDLEALQRHSMLFLIRKILLYSSDSCPNPRLLEERYARIAYSISIKIKLLQYLVILALIE